MILGKEGWRGHLDLKALVKAQTGIVVTFALVIISKLSELLQKMITLLCASL